MKRILAILLLTISALVSFAQGDTPRGLPVVSNPSAANYNKGRITDANLKVLLTFGIPSGPSFTHNNSTPQKGNMFYNTSTNQLGVWNGAIWETYGNPDLGNYYTKTQSDGRYIFASANTPQNEYISLTKDVNLAIYPGQPNVGLNLANVTGSAGYKLTISASDNVFRITSFNDELFQINQFGKIQIRQVPEGANNDYKILVRSESAQGAIQELKTNPFALVSPSGDYIYASPNTPQNKFIDLLGTVTVRDVNDEVSSMSATQFETTDIFANTIISDTKVSTTNLTNVPSIGGLNVSSSSALNVIGSSTVSIEGGNLQIRSALNPRTSDEVQFLVRNNQISPDTYYQDVQTIAFADMPFAPASPSGDYIQASPITPQNDFIYLSRNIRFVNEGVGEGYFDGRDWTNSYSNSKIQLGNEVQHYADTYIRFIVNGSESFQILNDSVKLPLLAGGADNRTLGVDADGKLKIVSSGAGNFISNQSTSAQDADAWIDGLFKLSKDDKIVNLEGDKIYLTNQAASAGTTITSTSIKVGLESDAMQITAQDIASRNGVVRFRGAGLELVGNDVLIQSASGQFYGRFGNGSDGPITEFAHLQVTKVPALPQDVVRLSDLGSIGGGFVDLTTTQIIGGNKSFSNTIGTNGIATSNGSTISMEADTKINFRDRNVFASGDYSIQQFGSSRLVFNRVGYSGVPNGGINFDGDAIFDSNVKYFVKSVNGVLADAAGNVVVSGGGGGSGTVTSVALTAPTGFDVGGSPVTSAGTLALTFASGYSLPSDATQATWTAKQAQLNGTGFVKATGTTITYDNSTYLTTTAAAAGYVDLTTNQTINGDKTFKGLLNIEKGGYLGSFGQGGQGGDSYFKFQGNAKSYDFVVNASDNSFTVSDGGVSRFLVTSGGNIGIGGAAGTARLHLPAGAAGAGLAPLRFTSGTNTTTAVAGQMEYNGTILTFTPTGTTRQTFAYLGLAQTWSATQTFSAPVVGTATATTLNTVAASTAFAGSRLVLTGSGTGAATTISIAHGLSGITTGSFATAQARNAASAGIVSVTADATNVIIVYSVAPASGTNNLSYSVEIKP